MITMDATKAPKWEIKKSKKFVLKIIGKFIIEGQILFPKDAINKVYSLFNDVDFGSEEKVKKILAKFDGFFAIIIENKKHIFVCTDRIRSYPLFYYISKDDFYLSDKANDIKEKYNLNEENKTGILEFLLAGIVTTDETLYLGLHQLLPGQFLIFNKEKHTLTIKDYYNFSPMIKGKDLLDIKKKYNEYHSILKKSFMQLKKGIEKYEFIPVIPLSGGRDSRLLAIMLKKVGINNAICYTFGTKNHPEVVKSKEIAKKLGYDWFFVKYTNKKWHDNYYSKQMNEYLNFASNFSNLPRFLDFIAVKELFEKQNKKYLFLPGHVLDFIAGSRIPKRVKTEKKLSFNDVFKSFIIRPYSFYPRNKKAEEIIKNKMIAKNKIPTKFSGWEAISFFESWEWKEKQGKHVINGLNIYHFFGFEWYTPFLEKDFLDFFSSLPYNFRYKQNFQKKALHYLFPNFYPEEKWLKPLNLKEKTIISKIKRKFGKVSLIKYLYNKKSAYRCLLTDFGLKRYTVFDRKSNNIKFFALKNVLTNNVKRIFYFYALEYLLRNNFNLNFLGSKYLKKLREVYKKD